MLHEIRTPEDLISLVKKFGFLPFFSTEIAGFSIDDLTPLEIWNEYLGLGPWLWRDEIAKDKTCIYGKFFGKKTGYVSAEWFPYLANYRRDGYGLRSAGTLAGRGSLHLAISCGAAGFL